MLIPRTGSEIKSDWLKVVVETYEKQSHHDVSFSVKEFTVKERTKPGENFSSDIASVEIEGQIQNDCSIEDKHYSLMIKFLCPNAFAKEVYKLTDIHTREMKLYSEVHKKLMKYQEEECQGKYKINIPDLYYGYSEGEDYVLVMQNMKPLGYVINDKTNGLNIHQLQLAVNQLARLHALSYAYNRKFNLLREYPHLMYDQKYSGFFYFVLEVILKNILPLISGREEFTEMYKKLQNTKEIIKKVKDNVVAQDATNTHSLNCLIHSDFWNNNLLYLYDGCGEDKDRVPTNITVIDWQMCQWNRAVIDLHYLLHTSTTYEVRKEHSENLLRTYYSVFEEITTALHCPLSGLTYESFKKEFDDSSIIGFIFGISLSQITLGKEGEKMTTRSASAVNVRSPALSSQSTIAKIICPSILKASESFIARGMAETLMECFSKEIREGNNTVMNSRLMDLIQEAMDKGTFDDIHPLS